MSRDREGRRKLLTRGRLAASLVVGIVVLIVWGVAAGMTGLGAAQNLTVAREQLIAAERSLRDAELSVARDELDVAIDAATEASDQLGRFYMAPLRIVPVIGPNLRAATTLSDTARDVGGATADLLDVAGVIVSDDRTQDPGEISLEYLAELGPPLRVLVDELQASTEAVTTIDPDPLIGRVASARQRFLDVVEPNLDQAVLAADLMDVLPSFLGEGEPRRYLIGAAALSEIRGSAGLLGSWSIMTAHEGRMDFEEFVDVDEMPQASAPVSAPSDDFERRYAAYGSLQLWRSANISPDFPAAAAVLMQLYDAGGGAPVDGVIVADTVVIEHLSERSDGLRIPGVGELRPDETLQFVALDAYETFEDDDERKRVLGATAAAAFAEMFEILEDDDVPATLEMLWALSEGGHFRVYSTDQAVQEVMVRAGVAGELPAIAGESVGFFTNNIGGNKIDWFERRSIDHRIELLPDGVTRATIDVTLRNDAPRDGYRRGILGPWTDITEAGDALSLTSFSCSTSCRIVGQPGGSTDGGTERGRPMQDATVLIPAEEERQFRYQTMSEDAWRFDGDQLILEVDHLVQPTLHGVDLTVRVDIPARTTLLAAPTGAEVVDGQVVARLNASGRLQQMYAFDGGALELSE